jgi:hypothetical protein
VERKSRKSRSACSERQRGPDNGIIILKHLAHLNAYNTKQYYMLCIDGKSGAVIDVSQHDTFT